MNSLRSPGALPSISDCTHLMRACVSAMLYTPGRVKRKSSLSKAHLEIGSRYHGVFSLSGTAIRPSNGTGFRHYLHGYDAVSFLKSEKTAIFDISSISSLRNLCFYNVRGANGRITLQTKFLLASDIVGYAHAKNRTQAHRRCRDNGYCATGSSNDTLASCYAPVQVCSGISQST